MRNHHGKITINVILNIVAALLEIVSLFSIIPFLSVILSKEEVQAIETAPAAIPWSNINQVGPSIKEHLNFWVQNQMAANSKLEILGYICLFILTAVLLKSLLLYISRLIDANIKYAVSEDVRNKVYNKVVHLPISFFTEQRRGDILNRFSTDILKLEANALASYKLLFSEPIKVVLILFFMIAISWNLTLFVFLLLPLVGLVIGRISKSLKRNSVKAQEKLSELMSMLDETLFGMRIIKSYTVEDVMERRFAAGNRDLKKINNRLARRRQASSPVSELMGTMVVVLVLWYGGRLILNDASNALDGPTFIAYILLFARLITPVKGLSTLLSGVYEGLASADRIDELLASINPIKNKKNAKKIDAFTKTLDFKNVDFKYESDKDEKILNNVSFTVNKGETLALVGHSGAGKSTIAALIPRFYDVDAGDIRIDGNSIKDLDIESLRKLISVVSQDSVLFNDSIINNIVFGQEDYDEARAIEAAKIANAHEFIMQTEHGYDTVIGDGGNKLSGGQKQRLTIARAMYKDAPLLILDEATSSLDTESEKLVQDAISKLMQNRTAVVIAHRLSTIKDADKILVMEDGKIIESGIHADLIAQEGGKYKHLFELQSL